MKIACNQILMDTETSKDTMWWLGHEKMVAYTTNGTEANGQGWLGLATGDKDDSKVFGQSHSARLRRAWGHQQTCVVTRAKEIQELSLAT